MKEKIAIVDDEPLTRMDIKDMLEQAGYEVVGEAGDGFEAIDICQEQKPDVVIMDIKMPLLDGLKAGRKIINDHLAQSIVYLSAYSDECDTTTASQIGAVGYLVKPLSEKSLLTTIQVGLAHGRRSNKLNQQVEQLNVKLEQRKVIEKAKGILMEENHLSEDSAYKMLRKLSMSKRKPMNDIAELIVSMPNE
jgi:response regulator NasT